MRTRKQKLTLREKKAQTRNNKMNDAKGNSNYARKKKHLKAHGGRGDDYHDKPWK